MSNEQRLEQKPIFLRLHNKLPIRSPRAAPRCFTISPVSGGTMPYSAHCNISQKLAATVANPEGALVNSLRCYLSSYFQSHRSFAQGGSLTVSDRPNRTIHQYHRTDRIPFPRIIAPPLFRQFLATCQKSISVAPDAGLRLFSPGASAGVKLPHVALHALRALALRRLFLRGNIRNSLRVQLLLPRCSCGFQSFCFPFCYYHNDTTPVSFCQ